MLVWIKAINDATVSLVICPLPPLPLHCFLQPLILSLFCFYPVHIFLCFSTSSGLPCARYAQKGHKFGRISLYIIM